MGQGIMFAHAVNHGRERRRQYSKKAMSATTICLNPAQYRKMTRFAVQNVLRRLL